MYRTITIPRSNAIGPCRVTVGGGVSGLLPEFLSGDLDGFGSSVRCVIITDRVVGALYGDLLRGTLFGGGVELLGVVEIGQGEGSKSMVTLEAVISRMLDLGCDRATVVVGVGGGVVCDVAGFAASVFMRGVRFGFVATTLLAQVDASVGGKNGVNVGGYKNIAGVFSQPEFVLCDLDLLVSLPWNAVQDGFVEVIKCGFLGVDTGDRFSSDGILNVFEQHSVRDIFENRELLGDVVFSALSVKATLVSDDFTDCGLRRLLNLGHTFGHAIEYLCTCRYSHGRAVALGICMAARVSLCRGMIGADLCSRIIDSVKGLGVETVVTDFSEDQILGAMSKDKKGVGGGCVNLILLRELRALRNDGADGVQCSTERGVCCGAEVAAVQLDELKGFL